jgi:hypothetical protein
VRLIFFCLVNAHVGDSSLNCDVKMCYKIGNIALHDMKCFANWQRATKLISMPIQLCSSVKEEC